MNSNAESKTHHTEGKQRAGVEKRLGMGKKHVTELIPVISNL